jgi:hypothetical protein
MGLGPTLVGGAIGAVAGMVLHLIVELTTGLEAPWFAVVIGLLTGLGVHQANKSLAGRVSYARGALAAAIALAAIVGSTPLISMVAKGREREAAAAVHSEGRDVAQDVAASDADGSETDGEPADRADDRARAVSQIGELTEHQGRPMRQEINVWQFLFMAVGTFIAYEFGRGTGSSGRPQSEAPPEEPMTVTDPSN